jgi:hypothetical protein
MSPAFNPRRWPVRVHYTLTGWLPVTRPRADALYRSWWDLYAFGWRAEWCRLTGGHHWYPDGPQVIRDTGIGPRPWQSYRCRSCPLTTRHRLDSQLLTPPAQPSPAEVQAEPISEPGWYLIERGLRFYNGSRFTDDPNPDSDV